MEVWLGPTRKKSLAQRRVSCIILSLMKCVRSNRSDHRPLPPNPLPDIGKIGMERLFSMRSALIEVVYRTSEDATRVRLTTIELRTYLLTFGNTVVVPFFVKNTVLNPYKLRGLVVHTILFFSYVCPGRSRMFVVTKSADIY